MSEHEAPRPETVEHARRLCEALPEWEADPDSLSSHWYVRLRHKTIPEAGLHFTYGRDKGKYEVSGKFPRDFEPDYRDRVSIGVSQSRSPEAIGRDVQKRLIDGYLPKLAEAVARRDEDVRKRAARLRSMNVIQEMFGKPPIERLEGRHNDSRLSFYPVVSDVVFDYAGETIKIDTGYLDAADAIKVLKLIRKLKGE